MSSRRRSGSGIFLMEMIMVCGFFLLCASVCVQVFIKADSMSRLAREKNQAVLAAQSLGERWKAGELKLDGDAEQSGMSMVSGESEVFFDEDWKPVETGEGSWYRASLSVESQPSASGAGQLAVLTVSIGRGKGHPRIQEKGADGEPLVLTSLQISSYRGEEAQGHG